MLLVPSYSWSQLMLGSMDVHWDECAANCSVSAQPPLQVHPYNPRTFILRENLCSTFEAPFMYLLIGSARAVLIDTGDVADPNWVPLAKTVMDLLPGPGSSKLPLLIVHTHRHLDHRAGDSQFAHLANVEIVGFDAGSVRHYYNFTDWPNGSAEINLGDTAVDVIATPGHNETEVSFYDPKTGLLFSGDFLLPGRLLVDNAKAYLASAERVVAFVQNRPITFVLGGHVEMNSAGQLFPWESQYHPQEHVLQMNKDDLLALPAALRSFNGFYTVNGKFTMMNSIHILTAIGVVLVAVVLAITLVLVRYLRRRKRARTIRADVQARLAREAEGRI